MEKLISKEDQEKLSYCENKCIGVSYCAGCREDGSDCEHAPSKEIIKTKVLESIEQSKKEVR